MEVVAIVISLFAFCVSAWSIHLTRKHKEIDLKIEKNDRVQEVLLDSLDLVVRFAETHRKIQKVVDIGASIPEHEVTRSTKEVTEQMVPILDRLIEEEERLSEGIHLLRKAQNSKRLEPIIQAVQSLGTDIKEGAIRFQRLEETAEVAHEAWTRADPVATASELIRLKKQVAEATNFSQDK